MTNSYKILSLYCFCPIDESNLLSFKNELATFENEGLTGLVILAKEGINGTVCGCEKIVNDFYEEIKIIFKGKDLNEKISFSKKRIFKKLKIKIKTEIVTMGIKDINPEINSGIYVDPENWNNLLNDKNTIVIDTRNHYEVSLGGFENAVNPNIKNFREFPDWLEKNLKKLTKDNQDMNIAMFCTGGIRCEKTTSLLLDKGYKNTYHLKGGILKYLENIPSNKNKYKGECYVFDERVSVDKNLNRGSYSICHACGMPLSLEDKKKLHYIRGVQCHLCINKFSDADRARFSDRQKQIEDKIKNQLMINKNSQYGY
tara:strand:+ start:74 stop:1015 length:942 start_codon:yes stop_codon:yes gene_type:complete